LRPAYRQTSFSQDCPMFLKEYRKEIFRPECNPDFQSVHCIAHLATDISEVLPYLNTVLGGSTYIQSPPSVSFKVQGKLIAVHSREIAINALKDEGEAEKILLWLKHEINDTWEKREQIKPSFQGISKPQALEILKLLPRNNCRRCGQATCMVFSLLVADGAKGPKDCPGLSHPSRAKLQDYLELFCPEP
jgi:ArsR family metal-binding transcriptional regulator